MRPPIDDGVVLVTGASSGMGQELARKLASRAKAMVLVARRQERLELLAAELRLAHPDLRVLAEPCDLTDSSAVDQLVEHVQGELGGVDVLINNAGSVNIAFVEEAHFDEVQRMIELNVVGLTYLTRLLLPGMLARGRGGILNVSSFFGVEILPGYAAYAGTKHYVKGFTEALRAECAGTGVVVSTAYPGPVKSAFWQVDNAETLSVPGGLYISVKHAARAVLAGFRRGRARIVPSLRMKLFVGFLGVSPGPVKRLVNGLLGRWMRARRARVARGANTSRPPEPDGRDWTFDGSWPYAPKWFRSGDGWMHYVDEGPREGPAVVLVHGNPTWGYLYRNFVPPLVDAGYRVVVPDLLGFGRSDKPDISEIYRIPRHAERLDALLESLDLHDATIVPQDWGGPIGLAWAGRHPERVDRLFILNTFAHEPLEPYHPPLAVNLFRMSGIGELLVKGFHVFVRVFLFRQGIVKRARMTETVRRAYLAPHPSWSSRTSVLVFPREIPVTPDARLTPFLRQVEQGLTRLADRPVFIAWAMDDPIFRPEFIDQFWTRTFPNAHIERIAEAGHYLQEDAHERLVPMLLGFLKETSAARIARVEAPIEACSS